VSENSRHETPDAKAVIALVGDARRRVFAAWLASLERARFFADQETDVVVAAEPAGTALQSCQEAPEESVAG
jgi:hypothetical protein